ncbi:MAG: class I SAM-dependent methyltransferase [Bacteroidales bacterium]|nr:class I SAM-dependent methyltransferase [Bacteroidales bacterium]MCF8344572.1 class I SAM-dependent methyltransferase [Bacteroidales bacterium]MCF8350687.1 class I SAM-dependent methyltransferase [Bacteroidales bacterium]MCF8376980.1 class I SAM-dependent methyltransferase [Bacteroidales bacterium]MCF8400867.1 class I SAM-dependent methyltransferase [Bacteroidales bacterium]
MKDQWYKEMFANYARSYDKEIFVKGTVQECDFIEQEINHDKSKKILDIGCGTGRHSIELAGRGYQLTGIDLSNAQIEHAREKAQKTGVEIDFRIDDATSFKLSKKFDLALIICEGAFSLLETDELNYKVLENAYIHLNNGGKIILTCLNALFLIFNDANKFINENSQEGTKSSHENFDLKTFRMKSSLEIKDDNGKPMKLSCDERYYIPSEINWYLKTIGFGNIGIYPCKTGSFARKDGKLAAEYELLCVAEK